jgi:hypothetical protein
MKKRILWTAIALVIAAASFMGGRAQGKPAAAQEQLSRCAIVIPHEWGDYVGASSYGVAFRDSNDTMRFINQFPCGQDGPPIVGLEIRRR